MNGVLVWKLSESIGVKMKSWIAESDFLFRDARVPRRHPSTRLLALVGENQKASAAGPPSKPEDYHRVNQLRRQGSPCLLRASLAYIYIQCVAYVDAICKECLRETKCVFTPKILVYRGEINGSETFRLILSV